MIGLFRLFIFLLAVCVAMPAEAGYLKDTCPAPQTPTRVRADLVFDLTTGKILIEKDATKSFHPASLTKLMSLALIFNDLEKGRLKYGGMVDLVRKPGQIDNRTAKLRRMTVEEAIGGVATASLNNALDGLAAKRGSAKFVERMNDQAKAWGMDHTFFVNPTGWPTPDSVQLQRTTLHDLATLVGAVWLGYPKEVARFMGKPDVEIAGLPKPLTSTNQLLETALGKNGQPYPGVIGGKTGYTCYSGWHLITVYEDRDIGRRMVAITVGHATGKQRDDYMKTLLDKGRPKLKAFAREEARRMERERIAAAKAEAARLKAEKKMVAAGNSPAVQPR